MRVTVQNHIDIFRRTFRWNVHEAKANASTRKIDNERPVGIAVAISAHHCHRQPNGAQFIQNPFRANIAEMPNFIRLSRQDRDFFWQTIVCIGQNKNPQWLGHLLNRELRG